MDGIAARALEFLIPHRWPDRSEASRRRNGRGSISTPGTWTLAARGTAEDRQADATARASSAFRPSRARDILAAMGEIRSSATMVFPGQSDGQKPLSQHGVSDADRAAHEDAAITAQRGFRSSFRRDWCGDESLALARSRRGGLLGHVVGGVEAAYRRSDAPARAPRPPDGRLGGPDGAPPGRHGRWQRHAVPGASGDGEGDGSVLQRLESGTRSRRPGPCIRPDVAPASSAAARPGSPDGPRHRPREWRLLVERRYPAEAMHRRQPTNNRSAPAVLLRGTHHARRPRPGIGAQQERHVLCSAALLHQFNDSKITRFTICFSAS